MPINTPIYYLDANGQAVPVSANKPKQIVITRPNDSTPYSIGDAIGDVGGSAIFELTGIGDNNALFVLTQVDLVVDRNSVPSGMTAGFELHLFKSSPTAIADNAAFSVGAADRAKWQGFVPLVLPTVSNGTLSSFNTADNKNVQLSATGSLFVVLKTLSAYTPTASLVKWLNIYGIKV